MNGTSDSLLSFVADDWLGGIPFALAPLSLLEARVLGGAAADGVERLPTGNHGVDFFVDMIVCYDGAKGPAIKDVCTWEEGQSIKYVRTEGAAWIYF